MLGKMSTAALLASAIAAASSLSTDRGYAKLTGQGFTNSSKPRNEKAKANRSKAKKSKASKKANRK